MSTYLFSWRRCLIVLTTIFLLPSLWATVQAGLTIEITKGTTGAVPVAVVSEDDHTQLSNRNPVSFEEIAQIIRNDLRTSGRFAPLRPFDMPQQDPRTVALQTWQNLGVENLISGSIESLGGDRYNVTFKLYDVFKMRPGTGSTPQLQDGEVIVSSGEAGVLTAKTYQNISYQNFRTLAHHISDVIYERLTGIRGAFSTRIAYVVVANLGRNRNSYRLEVADVDGYQPRPLVESNQPIMSPSWSPDGKKIAFVSFERNRAEIYVIDVTTGQRQLITRFPGINGAPEWSPDGSKLAVVLSKDGSPNIYLLDVATKQLQQITRGLAIDTEPTWAPDGRTLYFTSNRGGKPQIYKVDLASRQIARVTFKGDYNARPKVTPDGKYLVMIHRSQPGRFHIAAQHILSGNVKVLTDTSLDESPSLSPNGAMILYGTKEGDRRVLGLVTIDGRGHLRLPAREGSVQEPAWSPFLS